MVDEEAAQSIEDLICDIEDAVTDFGLTRSQSIGDLLDVLDNALENEETDECPSLYPSELRAPNLAVWQTKKRGYKMRSRRRASVWSLSRSTGFEMKTSAPA